ncbi:hypothetical protein ACFQ1L_41840 [Phytohabitans flavus]
MGEPVVGFSGGASVPARSSPSRLAMSAWLIGVRLPLLSTFVKWSARYD